MAVSLFEYCGISKSSCGYCKDKHNKASIGDERSISLGAWAHQLSPSAYLDILDCGWRRSGRYCYKPIMEETCCPQYTIRLDVNKFILSRSQKRNLKNVLEFLKTGKKTKFGKEEDNSDTVKPAVNKETSEKMVTTEEKPKKEKDETIKKKKIMRRERCFARWQAKGIDKEQKLEERRQKELNRRTTIESLVPEWEPSWKHKLEVKLVKAGSEESKERLQESYELYEKYQITIHKDERSSLSGFKRFLIDSPLNDLEDDETEEEPDKPCFGSYHMWYLLDDKLIAIGVIDILPRCLSSKYLIYDPDYAFLGLGTYTALREIHFNRRLVTKRPELNYYYMGYYIQSCPKMRYKGKFRPSELLCDASLEWFPLEESVEKILANDGKFTPFCERIAERKTRNDLLLLYKQEGIRYLQLSAVIPNYKDKETDEIRKDLDSIARYHPLNNERLIFFINEINQM